MNNWNSRLKEEQEKFSRKQPYHRQVKKQPKKRSKEQPKEQKTKKEK